MFTFIRNVVHNKKKDYILLLSILSLLAAFEFCFIVMYDKLSTLSLDYITFLVMSSIPCLSLATAIILSIFIANYFINHKQLEFSMLLLFGRSPKDLFIYLIIQYGILSIFAFIFGLFVGIVIVNGINISMIYSNIQFQFDINLSHILFMYCIFLMFTILFILGISAKQFTEIDCHLVETLNHKKIQKNVPYSIKMSKQYDKRKIPYTQIISSLLALYIVFYSLYAFIQDSLLQNKFIHFMLILTGLIMIINELIPLLFDIFHKYILKYSLLFHGLSSFIHMKNDLVSIANTNAVLIPVMLMILMMCDSYKYMNVYIIPCFIMMLVMIVLCFIIKYKLYLQTTKNIYATKYALGYTRRSINHIVLFKNIVFSMFVIVIPYIFIHYLGYFIVINGYLTSQVMMSLEGLYVILFVMLMIIMTYNERQLIKEVVQNVRYLNRGE